MRRTALSFIIIAAPAALAALAFFTFRKAAIPAPASLTVFCAAGLKNAVEAIATQYRLETGREISLQFGGTGTLLSQLRVSKTGDLFIAADESSMADARRFGLVAEEPRPLVTQHPVILVAAGNPHGIGDLADLLKAEVRLALPNPEAASIGKVCKAALGSQWEPLAAKAVVMKLTVMEIAADVKLGAADAALVWGHVVAQFPGLEPVEVAELSAHRENASVALLRSCRQPEPAADFAHYLSTAEKGGVIFLRQGFELPVSPPP